MSHRVVTFGEIMLRLKSPGHERFFQSPSLEATFGGAESNVAVSLAAFGLDAAFVTALPANPIGDSAVGELRRASPPDIYAALDDEERHSEGDDPTPREDELEHLVT